MVHYMNVSKEPGTRSQEPKRSRINKKRIIDKRRSQTVGVLHFLLRDLVSIHVPEDQSRS